MIMPTNPPTDHKFNINLIEIPINKHLNYNVGVNESADKAGMSGNVLTLCHQF
jgi:hypothetical protein